MGKGFGIGWRQVGACFVLLAATAFVATSYSLIAVPLAREFRPSRTVLMLAMTIMAGVSGLISPFLGSLMDRASMRRMMLIGAFCLAAGYAAISFATSFNQVLAIFGLLVAPANVLIGPVAATVLISRWFVRRRGLAIGIAISGIAMSSIVFPPIIQALLNHFPWREAFRLLALLLLLLAVPAALLVHESPAARGLHPDGADQAPADSAAVAAKGTVPVGVILGDPAFWIAVGIFAVTLSGVKGMITNLAPLVIDTGASATDAAWLISIYGTCGLISKLGFAGVIDFVGARIVMLASLGVFAAGMVFLTQASHGYVVIALGVALVGFSGGMMVPLQSYLVPQIFGRHCVGRAMGLMSTVMLVFLLSTPPLFGAIFDLTGSYTAIFLTFVALAVLVMALVPYLRLHPRLVPGEPPATVVGAPEVLV